MDRTPQQGPVGCRVGGGGGGWRVAGGLPVEVGRESGEERAFTPVLSPEGEPGPAHMAESL